MKRWLKYTLIAAIAVVALLLCGGYLLLGYALRPEGLQTRSRDIESSFEVMCGQYPELAAWTDSLATAGALQDIYMENDEGVTLHAYFICAPKPTGKTAVIVHGYTDNGVRMLPIGYLYNRQLGYNVLLPDLYAHGNSGGDAIRMGWKDRLDVLQWTAVAEELFSRHNKAVGETDTLSEPIPPVEMVVHGVSMGAATTMMLSGEVEQGELRCPYIKCFVEDCGYTGVWDEFRKELKATFHLPPFPLLNVSNLLCRWEYGWSFKEASALEQVKKCTRPMLFIHGDADTYVPTAMVYPLYEAKPGEKELWILPGVDHAHAYRDAKAEYTARIKAFVGKYIK